MTLRRRLAVLLAAIAVPFAAARTATAQQDSGSVRVIVPTVAGAVDTVSPAPVIIVNATPVPVPFQPSTLQLEVSLDAQFRAPFFARATQSLSQTFQLDSLLPQRRTAFFRVRLFDRFGTVRAETTFAKPVAAWLSLITATRLTNVLFTRTPRFEWNSPPITLPPGPWRYTLTVFNTAQNRIEFQTPNLSNTFFVPTVPLEACTSYSWSVGARAINGGSADTIVVSSPGTFVIQTADCPTATISYNAFPNPFGRGQLSNTTCFWFDLAHRSSVHLTVYDARLRQVKRIVPGPQLGAVLDSGAYGRPATSETTGCDPRLTWDGLDETGHVVPPGLYFAVFEADGNRVTHKIIFKGR